VPSQEAHFPKSSEGYGTTLNRQLAKNDVHFALFRTVRKGTVPNIQAIEGKKK